MVVDMRIAVLEHIPKIMTLISLVHLIVNLVWLRYMFANRFGFDNTLIYINVQSDIFFWFLMGCVVFDIGWLIMALFIWVYRDKEEQKTA